MRKERKYVVCQNCKYCLTTEEEDLPQCPKCGSNKIKRRSNLNPPTFDWIYMLLITLLIGFAIFYFGFIWSTLVYIIYLGILIAVARIKIKAKEKLHLLWLIPSIILITLDYAYFNFFF